MQLLLPILAGIVGGITQPIFKSITKNDYSFTSYLFVFALVGGIFSLPLLILNLQIPTNLFSWIWLFITCFLLLVGNLLLVKAFQSENISNIVLVGKIDLLVAFLSGIFLFRENATIIKTLAAIFIIAGILVIFIEKKKITYSKGLLYALLSGICIGFAAVISKLALKSFNPYFFQSFPYFFTALILIFLPKTLVEAKKIFTISKYKIIIVEILSVISYILVLLSIKAAGLSVGYFSIDPVYTLTAVLIGIIILKEKDKLINKIIGTLLIVLGLIGLV